MCHHTPEPTTVLSRLSCRPSHLNFDRFHQPCLLPGGTSRIGEVCRPRTKWRPLTLAGTPVLPPCVRLEVFATPTGLHHGRMLIHPSPSACATPGQKGARTNAGSGPSRVRRRLLRACLGDPISSATRQTFVTSFCPFCYCTRKLVRRPQNIRSPNTSQIH